MDEAVDPAVDRPGEDSPDRRRRAGVLAGAASYVVWGLFPFFFTALAPAGALELLAQRVLWSLAASALLLTLLRRWPRVLAVWRDPARARLLALAAIAIAVNWGVYGLAVTTGHVLEASLGYFVNPVLTVLLGVVVLRERLRRTQWVAIGTGLVAVLVITLDLGRLPWMALSIAVSFGGYGLLKNRLGRGSGGGGGGVDPLTGLTVETAVLALPAAAALVWLGARGGATFATEGSLHLALLIASGPLTLGPLLLFAVAAGRVPLSTMGLLQYVTPVLQFAAAFVLGESMPASRWIGFALVWVALALLTADALRGRRAPAPAGGAPTRT